MYLLKTQRTVLAMFRAIQTQVQAQVDKALLSAFDSVNVDLSSTCKQNVFQSIALAIENSNITVSGDFVVNQQARATMACAQSMLASDANLRTDIEKKFLSNLKKSLAGANLQIDSTKLEQYVQQHLPTALTGCTVSETQGIAIAPTIKVIGSTLKVGCLDSKVQQNEATCIDALLKRGPDAQNDPACKYVVDCTSKTGDLSIEMNVDYSSECNKLFDLASAIAFDVVENRLNPKSTNTTSTTGLSSVLQTPGFKTGIAIAGILLLLLVLVIVVVVRNKRESARQMQHTVQMYQPIPYQSV